MRHTDIPDMTFKTADLLEKLEANRKKHAEIVKEAREGYIEEAKKALQAKLRKVKAGKMVALSFHLAPPEDHTSQYDTVIEMLKMCVEDEIELSASDFRKFVQDEWDWTGRFLANTVMYSQLANDEAMSKGMSDWELDG